jgi:hypothetical protein
MNHCSRKNVNSISNTIRDAFEFDFGISVLDTPTDENLFGPLWQKYCLLLGHGNPLGEASSAKDSISTLTNHSLCESTNLFVKQAT